MIPPHVSVVVSVVSQIGVLASTSHLQLRLHVTHAHVQHRLDFSSQATERSFLSTSHTCLPMSLTGSSSTVRSERERLGKVKEKNTEE